MLGETRDRFRGADMTARERFAASLAAGDKISALAFTGSLRGFTAADRAWLRREIKAGRILEAKDQPPFGRSLYASPEHWAFNDWAKDQ